MVYILSSDSWPLKMKMKMSITINPVNYILLNFIVKNMILLPSITYYKATSTKFNKIDPYSL